VAFHALATGRMSFRSPASRVQEPRRFWLGVIAFGVIGAITLFTAFHTH